MDGLKVFAAIFILSVLGFGQGAIVSPQQALGKLGNGLIPMSAATVTVCAANSPSIPCSPALANTLFKDAALTQSLTNPFSADTNGNYQFAIAPGQYTVTTTASGFNGYSYQLSVPIVPSGNNTFTANNTFTGVTTTANLNGVLSVSQCAGVDIGAQLNTCYANLPSTGGRIRVPNSTSCYAMSTSFSATVSGKPVLIEGDPGVPTCINWVPTSGTAFTFDTRLNSNQHPVGMGMRDLVLTTSGAASSTAVVLGATNSAEGYTFLHVKIENFITGVSMTTSSGLTGTFAVAFLNDVFRNMTSCIVATGSGSAEMTKFIGGSFFNCGTAISSSASLSADFTVIGTSCDDPGAGGCIGNSVIVNWYGGHFENPGGGLPTYVNSNGIVNLYGGVALDDCIGSANPVPACTATNSTSWFSLTGSDSMTILGTELFSGGRSMTTNPVVSVGGTGHGQLALYNKTPSLLTPLYAVNALVFSQITDLSWTNGGIQTNALQSWKVPETGSTIPTGQAQFDLCYGDPTAHAIKCNYNNTSFFNQTQTIATGTATMTTAAITAPACGTTVTVTATGVVTTDTITWAFNAVPAGTNAGIVAWPTSGNVNFAYCPGVTETPAAATLNWRVVR